MLVHVKVVKLKRVHKYTQINILQDAGQLEKVSNEQKLEECEKPSQIAPDYKTDENEKVKFPQVFNHFSWLFLLVQSFQQ